MPQLFPPSSNTLARASIVGFVLFLIALGGGGWVFVRSPYITFVGMSPEQPVPFSHKHHVGDDGIDCRYCHTSVETSTFAGIPPTQTCMNCHSQIWAQSPMLQPVRDSFQNDTPLQWARVHNLPDYAYFNHSLHIDKGVGCSTCHGRVDEMPLMHKAESLQMGWCLECHFNPEKYVRPRDQIWNMAYEPPADQIALGQRLIQEYDIHTRTSCSTCHR